MVHKNRKYNPKERPRTIDAQIVNMRACLKDFECKRSRDKAVWIGLLQPMPISRIYRVKIRYQIGDIPKVFVLSPALEIRKGEERIPHTYSDNEICVYWPAGDEWNGQKFISDTIIPWTILWLFHYEIWLATGKWLGGGVHFKKHMPYRKPSMENNVRAG